LTIYADSSALLKLYVDEADSETAETILRGDPDWITGWHTRVEVRRNLARVLSGDEHRRARADFFADWDALEAVRLTERTCELAAEYAEQMGVRALDALHLGAAATITDRGFPFATFDHRLAAAARSLGWEVLGA
jgi:uncharacterized protein